MVSKRQALEDPEGTFDAPEDVIKDDTMDEVTKLKVLNKWYEDAYSRSVAQNEGMEAQSAEATEPTVLQRVDKAILELGGTPPRSS